MVPNSCSKPLPYSALIALLVIFAGLAPSAARSAELAQTPLFLGSNFKPNFILAIDDSFSMGEQRVFPGLNLPWLAWNTTNGSFFVSGQPETLNFIDAFKLPNPAPPFVEYTALFGDGGSGYIGAAESLPPFDDFGFARSSDFNKLYFNPAVEYSAWKKYDGSSWSDADPSAARADPRSGAHYEKGYNAVFDFTSKLGRQIDSDPGFMVLPGMTIPKGSTYRTQEGAPLDCGDWGGMTKTDGSWVELAADFKVIEKCRLGLRSFPATFFLRDPLALPADFGYIAQPLFVSGALGPGGSGLHKYEIRPENFMSQEAYDAAILNFANWFQYHGNKILAMVASMTEAFLDIKDVRVGQFNINHRDDVKMYDLSLPFDRAQFYDKITSLQVSGIVYGGPGSTPNRDGVDHIGVQFSRTDPGAPIEAACQVNVGMLFTDGYTTKGTAPNLVGNADGALGAPFADAFPETMADIVTSYYEGANTPLRNDLQPGQVPVSSSCEGSPEPWMDCQANLHMRFHAVAFGPQGSIYGVNAAATENPYLFLPDWNAAGAPNGSSGPVAVDELWHATINGRGTFVNANSPAKVTSALKDALAFTQNAASITGGAAASSSRRDEGFLGYVPRYNATDWTGDLTAHVTSDGGEFSATVWSAASKLQEMKPELRKIFFSDAGVSLKPFDVGNLGGEQAAIDRLGFDPSAYYWRPVEEMVAYLRGRHTYEKKNGVGELRDRTSPLGDIFGSQPEILTSAGFGYSGLPKAMGGGASGLGSYGEFVQTTKKTRIPVAFVGANDGMLHAFDASAGATGGSELFAVIPASVMKNMGKLPDPAYHHRYFVDGSPVQGDAWNGSWKTVLLVPMGAGGKSVVALDVTDPAKAFGPENFLWEFTDPDLHETISKPSLVMLEDGTWVAVFGGGIDRTPGSAGNATLFIVDLFTGTLLHKILLPPPSNLNQLEQNGVVAYVPVDRDYNLMTDTIYVADYDAQLWRLDADAQGQVTMGNGGERIFRAMDRNGRPLVVTGGMDSFPHHIRGQMVFFGTGRYLLDEDTELNPGLTQAFFGIWDDPENPSSFDRTKLKTQHILEELNVDGVETRRLTNEPVDWSTQRGWMIDLAVKDIPNSVAELAIGEPVVALGRVTFTTFSPSAGDSCSGSGLNRLYSVSATSGVGELALPGAEEGAYGSVEIPASSVSGPILAPALVTSPPAPACVPGSPDCPIDPGNEEGSVLAAPSAGCKTPLGVLLGDGLLTFDNLTCGRQSWQQLQ